MITVKIDVSKIDKSRFFTDKSGRRWLDLVLIETPNSKYGNDYMVKQSQTKQERERKEKGIILGNGKNIKSNGSNRSRAPRDTGGADDDW